ncbi:hypothetical protein BBJ28_00011745 [Nothophytophthora sp. Chile5]|nr:hypothetical protein BBJ28_00011745 [Nothophytophthora sp. Chile5]
MTSFNSLVIFLHVLVLFAFNSVTAKAWWGTVTFYDNWWHDDSGGTYTYQIGDSQQCINLSCYQNRITSAKWDDLVNWGAYDGKARIAFYTERNCAGKAHDWPATGVGKKDFPGNFFLDGIDNKITSFMIWQFSDQVKYTSLPCPWDFKCCLK